MPMLEERFCGAEMAAKVITLSKCTKRAIAYRDRDLPREDGIEEMSSVRKSGWRNRSAFI
jgi:hypothetical protein